MINSHIKEILNEQSRRLEDAKQLCITKNGLESLNERRLPIFNKANNIYMCPAYWDGILCWADTPANSTAYYNCPSYIMGFISINNATRKCMENSIWYIDETQNSTWTNYTNCFKNEKTTILVEINKSHISQLIQNYLPIIKIISQTGYTVSLFTLIIAFLILICIKKLHCSRNFLHMHLFISFILRAFIFLLKDLIFINGIGLSNDMAIENGSLYFSINSETDNWSCKLVTSLWQYFITANYSWILMEGIFLHNLIFRALFSNSNKNIKWYIIWGWGFPFLIVGSWILTRLWFENTLCWTTHDNYKVFLILAIPIMISIIINLIFFIRISIVLYSKVQTPLKDDSHHYFKWAKSTLILVPLFGIHYALLLGLYYSIKTNRIIELIWLICDQLFGSFQGFFVAILFCFLNGEVKTELKLNFFQLLTTLATNKYIGICFPFRKTYLKSKIGRPSFYTTTLSCNSSYKNNMLHKKYQSRSVFKCSPLSDKNSSKIIVNGDEHITELKTMSSSI